MESFANELIHLLKDGPHWAFEAISDTAFAAVGFLVGRKPFHRWLDRGHPGPRHMGDSA